MGLSELVLGFVRLCLSDGGCDMAHAVIFILATGDGLARGGPLSNQLMSVGVLNLEETLIISV